MSEVNQEEQKASLAEQRSSPRVYMEKESLWFLEARLYDMGGPQGCRSPL